MAIQTRFRRFDDNIRLRRLDENAELVEKRDRVLARLRAGIERQFPDRYSRPTFVPFNQGSYEMGTGVKPVNGRDYDIDVGVRFDIQASQYDPVLVKGWVHEAVKDHTSDVQFRRSCITVFYKRAGETAYHVDLAIYGKGSWGTDQLLATGKQHSSSDQRKWQPSKPTELTNLIGNHYSGEDAEQFRRVIRCLKRWKDVNFSFEGNAAPRGIALTACVYHGFAPAKSSSYYQAAQYDDLAALRRVVDSMLGGFSGWPGRLRASLPVPPGNDLFEKMTDQQMAEFKAKLERLRDALNHAAYYASANEFEASRRLAEVLGSDFPA